MSSEPLIRERNPNTKENVLFLIISLFVLVLAIVAFFIALNNYLQDQKSRTRIATQQELIQAIALQNQLNQRTQTNIINKEQQLDILQSQCITVINQFMQDQSTLINAIQPTFDLYNIINNTINTQNINCNNTIINLSQTFHWLINVTIQNSTIVYSGLCRFNSLAVANGTINIAYNYKLLDLNGVDFYFYEFINSTAAVDASMGVTIQGCSPRIFKGQPIVNKALNTQQLSGITFESSPLSMPNYLSHVEFGGEILAFIPKVIPSVNQTLRITENGFRIWTNVLF